MSRKRQFLALTGLAVTELFRQPVCFLILLTQAACAILTPLALSYQLGQQTHLAMDGALAFEWVFGVLLAGYAACSTLHHECSSGTVLTVLSKPVGRGMFFLAKYAAVALLLACFVVCATCAALLAVRLTPQHFASDALGLRLLVLAPAAILLPAALLNFTARRSFVAVASGSLVAVLLLLVAVLGSVDHEGHRVAFGAGLDLRLVAAGGLVGLGLLILGAMALGLAAWLPPPATVTVLGLMLFGGLISDYLAERARGAVLREGLRILLPDLQAFWPADRLAGGGRIGLAALGQAALYAAAYGGGVLCLGVAAFRRREF